MKRLLLIPALGCLITFVSMYAFFERAEGDEEFPTSYVATSSEPLPPDYPASPRIEAQRMLDVLVEQYQQRRQEWEQSPHRRFSRAMVRPVYPTRIEYALAPQPIPQGSGFVLATVQLQQPEQIETIPCVIDPTAGQIRLFHYDAWLTDEEWLNAVMLR
jgi:hypothetical protein